MIDLRLDADDDHEHLRSTLRSYLQAKAPGPEMNRLDAAGEFPEAIVDGLAALGIFGLSIPEEYGGVGADAVSVAIACEELQRAGLSLLSAVAPTITYCAPAIQRFGTEAQRREILPGIASGALRMAIGLTEPDAGSDLSAVAMSGRAVDGGFVVNGTKVWCTGAARADYVVALVRTDPQATGYDGLSVLLVPTGRQGDGTGSGGGNGAGNGAGPVTIRKISKLAGQATASCEVFVDDLFVDARFLVGRLHQAREVIFSSLDSERLFVAAQCVGVAQGAYDTALDYAVQRRQFGRPIIEHQAIGHKLADMAARVMCARLFTYSLAAKVGCGEPYGLEAALAKVMASEAAAAVVNDGMAVLGAYSYSTEYPMERFYREIKLLEIAGGTNQILRNVIAKRLPGARF